MVALWCVSRVCVVCYLTHHRVMSQARDDFEGFLKTHMSEEEKVIVQVEISLTASRTHTHTHTHTHTLTH